MWAFQCLFYSGICKEKCLNGGKVSSFVFCEPIRMCYYQVTYKFSVSKKTHATVLKDFTVLVVNTVRKHDW